MRNNPLFRRRARGLLPVRTARLLRKYQRIQIPYFPTSKEAVLITCLYVRSGHRGKGHGRKLLQRSYPLKLNVPRTRYSNSFPKTLPGYRRTYPEEYENLLESFLFSARSTEALKESIKNMKLPLSPGFIDEPGEQVISGVSG